MVADVSHYTLAALDISKKVIGGLKVHEQAMADNAREAAEAVCTEALMLTLGEHIGKQSALAHVYEVSQAATSAGLPLREQLQGSPTVRDHLSAEELERIFDPSRYVGSARELTAGTVERAEAWLASRGSSTAALA